MDGFTVMASQPGQLSLAIDMLKGKHDLTRDFQADLAAIRGIHRVEADPGQGLVVVSYDKQQLTSFMSLLALKSTFSTFFPEINALQLASWLSQSI
jgi:Heavy metal associated domain 2